MNIQVNRERLADIFTKLCEIESPSLKEGKISSFLQNLFTELGAESVYEDNSKKETGSESGNLIIRFAGKGTRAAEKSFFLSCHMDTVSPTDKIKVKRTGDIFTSAGDTILGGDDKSGIAGIVELLYLLKENDTDPPPIEIIITVCEEQGVVGARYVEFDKIQSSYGYALDSSGIDQVIVAAPASSKFEIIVTGKEAHAGLAPQSGISAISLAAKALAQLEVGQLDEKSTRNFGVIHGGTAANIIAGSVSIICEVRSHDEKRLEKYIAEIHNTFQGVIDSWQPNEYNKKSKPGCQFVQLGGYPALRLADDSPVISRVRKAAKKANKKLTYKVAGGGSDANIFFNHGLQTAIIATGMSNVHTLEESLDLNDLVSLVELLFAITISN